MLKSSKSLLPFGVAAMLSPKQASVRNAYEMPCLRKLEPEEAKQFLLHHAELGDPDAKELLALVLPGNDYSGA